METVELHVFADDHVGDPHSDIKLIQQRVERVRTTPNAYAVLAGDEINNAIAGSKSDIYSEALSPVESIEKVAELYRPIKDKILAIHPGNHSARSWRAAGLNPTKQLALELGLKDKYFTEPVLMFLRFGRLGRRKAEGRKVSYAVYITHGSGGGKKAGAKANRVEDLASVVDADAYIHSHTHLPLTFKKTYFRTRHNNSSVLPVTKVFVNTAAALDYGGYGSTNGFSPASKDNPIVVFDGTRRDIKVIV